MDSTNNIIHRFSYSREVIGISIIATLILIGSAALMFFTDFTEYSIWYKKIIPIILIITILITACYAPKNITSNSSSVDINMLFFNRKYRYDHISSIQPISRKEIRPAIRTFGSGGLFGYLGKFRNTKIGPYSMYATSFDDLVLITLKDGKKVVTNIKEEELIQITKKLSEI